MSCLSICCRRKPVSKPAPRGTTQDRDHDGAVYFDVISDFRDKRGLTNEDILSFQSFESFGDIERELSRYTADATPTPAELRQRGILKCSRTGEFYGYRERIPSDVDTWLQAHPDNYWWSNGNLQSSTIARDLGPSPLVLSRVVKVTVVPSSFFASHRDMEVFPEYLALCEQMAAASTSRSAIPRPRISLIIFKIKVGDQVMVSLNEVINEAEFDRMMINQYSRDELLTQKMKLIVSPINTPLPIPVKKPRDAETIGAYFGMDNVDLYFDESLSSSKTRVVSVLINIYSKWIIRKFLPIAINSVGRICDFVLLSSDDKVVFADFRLLCTNTSKALIKGTPN